MSNTETQLHPAVQKILAVPASPQFMAILDFALDNPTPRISPQVTSLSVTSDGFLMMTHEGRGAQTGFVGDVEEFNQNLEGICRHCGVSANDYAHVRALAYTRITDWRRLGK